jgi:hypothetical protein
MDSYIVLELDMYLRMTLTYGSPMSDLQMLASQHLELNVGGSHV